MSSSPRASGRKQLEMPPEVKHKMEHAFQTDFSPVHFMESGAIGDHGARAVTQGNTVGFAPGQFSPHTAAGQELIGHELSHVVSQARGEVQAPQAKLLPFVASAGLEAQADREGARAARGQSVDGAAVTISPMSDTCAPMQGKLFNKGKKKDAGHLPEGCRVFEHLR